MKKKFSNTPFLIIAAFAITVLFDACVGIVYFNAPCSADAGETIQLDFRLKRDVNFFSPSNVHTLYVYISKDQYFDREDIPLHKITGFDLFPNSYKDISVDCTIPDDLLSGQYFLIAISNDHTTISPEIYKGTGTNVYHRQININGSTTNGADLSVTNTFFYEKNLSIKWGYYDRKNFIAGQNITTVMTVENRGDEMADNSYIQLFFSKDPVLSNDDPLVGGTVEPINGQGRKEMLLDFIVPYVDNYGYYYVIFSADHFNQISEPNEQDNIVVRRVYVELPYLQFAMAYAPALVFSETDFDVSAQIDNYASVSDADTVRIFISEDDKYSSGTDEEVGQFDIPPIGFNESYFYNGQINLPDNIVTGEYYLLFRIGNNINRIYPVRQFVINYSNFNGNDPCEEIENAVSGFPEYVAELNEVKQSISEIGLKTFPNPASEYFNINIDFPEDIEDAIIELTDLQGKRISHVQIPKIDAGYYEERIPTSHLPTGTYILSLHYDDKVFTEKIIVN